MISFDLLPVAQGERTTLSSTPTNENDEEINQECIGIIFSAENNRRKIGRISGGSVNDVSRADKRTTSGEAGLIFSERKLKNEDFLMVKINWHRTILSMLCIDDLSLTAMIRRGSLINGEKDNEMKMSLKREQEFLLVIYLLILPSSRVRLT